MLPGGNCRRAAALAVPLIALVASLSAVDPGAAAPAHVAWVQVSVATVWHRPASPRPIDLPALGDPARVESWLANLSVVGRLGLDSRINTQVLLDEEVIVSGHWRGWSRVEVPTQRGSKYPDGILGWIPTAQLSSDGPPAGERQVIVSVARAWLHAVDTGRVGRGRFLLSYDTELPVLGSLPGYLVVGLPRGAEGAVATSDLSPLVDAPVSGGAVVAEARRFLGLPYLWGGTSAFGYDCSGLVYAIFARYGVELPRDAADQQRAGKPVSLRHLHPGDLLFFAAPGARGQAFHVAIYAGGGEVIDSPYTGAAVEQVPMTSLPVWADFSGAARVPGVG